MKIVTNNLLVLLISLSPIANSLDLMNCHTSETSKATIVNCHETEDQQFNSHQISNFITTDCCDNGQCGCTFYVFIDPIFPEETIVIIDHKSTKQDDHKIIPFKEFQTPFRPPIS